MLCQIPDSKQNKNTLNSAKKSEGQGREKLLVLMQCLSLMCLSLLYNNFYHLKIQKMYPCVRVKLRLLYSASISFPEFTKNTGVKIALLP